MRQTCIPSLLAILTIVVLLASCTPTYEVLRLKSNLDRKELRYTYIDSAVELRYVFWSNQGIVEFAIINRSSKPIYVDWTKSNFVVNGLSQNYFESKQTLRGGTSSATAFVSRTEAINVSSFGATMSTENRINHLPPRSGLLIAKFRIGDFMHDKFNRPHFPPPQPGSIKRIPNGPNERPVTVIKNTFEKEQSPMIVRNYISYGFKEDLSDVIQVDNEFWVSEVLTMQQGAFRKYDPKTRSQTYPYLDYGAFFRIHYH